MTRRRPQAALVAFSEPAGLDHSGAVHRGLHRQDPATDLVRRQHSEIDRGQIGDPPIDGRERCVHAPIKQKGCDTVGPKMGVSRKKSRKPFVEHESANPTEVLCEI